MTSSKDSAGGVYVLCPDFQLGWLSVWWSASAGECPADGCPAFPHAISGVPPKRVDLWGKRMLSEFSKRWSSDPGCCGISSGVLSIWGWADGLHCLQLPHQDWWYEMEAWNSPHDKRQALGGPGGCARPYLHSNSAILPSSLFFTYRTPSVPWPQLPNRMSGNYYPSYPTSATLGPSSFQLRSYSDHHWLDIAPWQLKFRVAFFTVRAIGYDMHIFYP